MTKHIMRGLAAVGAGTLALSTSVHAALPAGITASIDAVEADGVEIVGLVAAAGAAIYLIAKVLARFGFKL